MKVGNISSITINQFSKPITEQKEKVSLINETFIYAKKLLLEFKTSLHLLYAKIRV